MLLSEETPKLLIHQGMGRDRDLRSENCFYGPTAKACIYSNLSVIPAVV